MKKIIISFLTVLILGSVWNCSSRTSVKNPNLQREWMLVSFSDFPKEELIKNKAVINLTAKKENGMIPGGAFMGCNKMFFTIHFKDNGKVKISGLGGTMMVCDTMKLESSFAQSFENMTRYSIKGHELVLSDEKENEMKFVAADWD